MQTEMIHYTHRLRDFVASRNQCFNILDALEYLGLEPDADGTHYAITAIANALKELGCARNYVTFDGHELIAYYAPGHPATQQEETT